MKLFLATICVSLLLNNVRRLFGANILVMVPCAAPSHFVVFEPLILELTKRGHILWVVSHFPQKTAGIPNNINIDVSGIVPNYQSNVPLGIIDLYTDYYLSLFYEFLGFFEDVTDSATILESNEMKRLLKTDVKFDLIIAELFSSDMFVGFAYKFKAPLISIVSSMPLPWSNDRVSNIENPSYTTHMFSLHAGQMGFTQRLVNTIDLALSKLAHVYFNYYAEGVARRFFGEDLPPLSSLVKNTSMVFVNSFPAFNGVRPITPQVVEIGGIHVKPAKQLPHVVNALILSGPETTSLHFPENTVSCPFVPRYMERTTDDAVNVLTLRLGKT